MMNNGNGPRPLSRKQTVRLMIALTILAWATQTLLRQWGFGAELSNIASAQPQEQRESFERFVPGTSRFSVGATLEVRPEATTIGAEVKLRQVCRWADRDKAIFDPIGDLVLSRLGPRAPFMTISVNQIRGTLKDAGVNIAAINFAGATSCTVARSDVEYDESSALQQWIEAKQEPDAEIQSATAPSTHPTDPSPVQTLRDLLMADLSSRTALPVESLQVTFKSQDEKTLNLSKPLFDFTIEPLRAKTIGSVLWNVTITREDKRQKISIAAEARAWQNQVVALKPLSSRQLITAQDVVERRALVDQLPDDTLLSLDQVVGQQAAREMKPGMVFTAKTIDPAQLVKVGQFVTVTLVQGAVRLRTVARALEGGCHGQTIRVKNEATKEVFQVVLTGPQTATMNLGAPIASMNAQ